MEIEQQYLRLSTFFRHYDVVTSEGEFVFEFVVSDESLRDIKSLIDIGVIFTEFQVEQAYDFEELSSLQGKSVRASISRERLVQRGLFIFIDWCEFFEVVKHRLEPPTTFYIVEDEELFPEDKDKASRLRGYLKILDLIEILEGISELEPLSPAYNKMKISFIHKARVDVEIDYSAEELDCELGGVDILNKIFESSEHETQRNSIFKETLYAFLVAQKKEERFRYLLSRMSEFSTEFLENYQLFISEFSLESVRKEYEEKKRDYVAKINDVISDVHTRMLGVPAILVLAAFRFSDDVKSGQLYGNVLILIAVIIYIAMMHYLIRSQKDTLNAISEEAEQHIESFKKKGLPSEIGRIGEISEQLKSKCANECKRLNIFYWMIGLLLAAVISLVGYSAYIEFNSPVEVTTDTLVFPPIDVLPPCLHWA
ncbi:hypothetical protein [Marinobacter sp. SS13-12]|uniref:hypothetical protein n=1 Tax=Marinobacter sp. SS13-12 TaxID=3050451 RepID=UPI002557BF89|nr:hypothetical protein [Marinobacter sp. SS13-12]MDK8463437.1 hypothetical protein [Marinobacter sp. SS13-12]